MSYERLLPCTGVRLQVIDGSHEFHPTLQDLLLSRVLSMSGGIVLMDDIVPTLAPGELWRVAVSCMSCVLCCMRCAALVATDCQVPYVGLCLRSSCTHFSGGARDSPGNKQGAVYRRLKRPCCGKVEVMGHGVC